MTRDELVALIRVARYSYNCFELRGIDEHIADAIIAKGERLSPGSVNFIKTADADTTVHLVIDVQPVCSKPEREVRACYWLGRIARIVDEANKEVIG